MGLKVLIGKSLKDIFEKEMGSKDIDTNRSKAEHLLQMSILKTANHH